MDIYKIFSTRKPGKLTRFREKLVNGSLYLLFLFNFLFVIRIYKGFRVIVKKLFRKKPEEIISKIFNKKGNRF